MPKTQDSESSRQSQYQILQLLEIWCSQSRHWVPTHCRIPARIGDNASARDGRTGLSVDSIAANTATTSDIVQSSEADEI